MSGGIGVEEMRLRFEKYWRSGELTYSLDLMWLGWTWNFCKYRDEWTLYTPLGSFSQWPTIFAMSGDFQDWDPTPPPESQHVAPPVGKHFMERNPYGGCLRLAIVALTFAAAVYFVVWKWIAHWISK